MNSVIPVFQEKQEKLVVYGSSEIQKIQQGLLNSGKNVEKTETGNTEKMKKMI